MSIPFFAALEVLMIEAARWLAEVATNTYTPNSSTPSAGMAHTAHSHQHLPHRTNNLPHPPAHLSTREQYSSATPTFRRGTEHPTRSPSFPGAPQRRHQLSPTLSPLATYSTPAGRMEVGPYQNQPSTAAVPPLQAVQTTGSLQYLNGTHIKIDITGTVDKGFFLAEGEWTCYRRNYMTCACSYALYPHHAGHGMQYTPSGSSQTYQVYGFSMCISAVVADSDQHSIDLVQHTPKRDKGPISKPEKIPLAPKNAVSTQHGSMFSDNTNSTGPRTTYTDSFGGSHGNGQIATEHTFERIQFKQATQNNGKRRAAQQYYHLIVELWADLGSQVSDKNIKVAFRKSEKMIVRGRSPGHYQNEKRRSQSGGPGSGISGALGDFTPVSHIGDFSGSTIYHPSFDQRGPTYPNNRQHDIPSETNVPPEEVKPIPNGKSYQYYANPIYEGPPAARVEQLCGSRSETETTVPQMGNDAKVKSEYDLNMMPRIFHPALSEGRRQQASYEGKQPPSGYYSPMMTPGANMNPQ